MIADKSKRPLSIMHIFTVYVTIVFENSYRLVCALSIFDNYNSSQSKSNFCLARSFEILLVGSGM